MEFFFTLLAVILLIVILAFFFILALVFGLLGWILKGLKEVFGVGKKY